MTVTTLEVKAEVTVGQIFVSQWGYDANNVDFYQVLKVTPTMVTVVALQEVSLNTGNRYAEGNHVTAGTTPKMVREWGDYDAELNTRPLISETPLILRRKIKGARFNQVCFDVNEYARAYPWNGEAILEYNNH